MNSTSLGVIKFHTIDIRRQFTIFWSIFVLTLILGIVVALSFENANIYYMNSIAVYIFVTIIGYQSLRSSFSNLIQWGVTRKIYFLLTSIFFILFAFIMALVNNILLLVFNQMSKWLSLSSIHFSYLGQFANIRDNFASRVFIDFSICLALISIALLVSSILFKYGLFIMGLLVVFLIVLTFIPETIKFVLTFMQNFLSTDGLLYFFYLVLGSLLLFFVSWAVMRRSFYRIN